MDRKYSFVLYTLAFILVNICLAGLSLGWYGSVPWMIVGLSWVVFAVELGVITVVAVAAVLFWRAIGFDNNRAYNEAFKFVHATGKVHCR